MIRKLNIFCCLRSNIDLLVDLKVTLNEVLTKSKKLGCPENTDLDLCLYPIVFSWKFFVINITELKLD